MWERGRKETLMDDFIFNNGAVYGWFGWLMALITLPVRFLEALLSGL